jgi:MFS family permease
MTSVNPDRRRWIALALLAMAQLVVVLDASIVNVALPSIGRGLHFSQASLSWVVNAYVLTFGGFLLLGGRMADLIGRRKMFIAGLIVFALASLAGGLAQSEGWLIAARAVQGLGAAVLSPAALSIVTTTFAEGADRNKALGVWGAVAGSGGAAGVLLGGVLTSGLGWRWVLFVNVPIGVIAALLAPRLIDESRAEAEQRNFDVAGAVSVTAGLSILVYALVDAQSAGWGSLQTVALLAISVLLLLGAFVLIESRAGAPLVPFRIFRQQTVAGANVTGLLIGASLFSMFSAGAARGAGTDRDRAGVVRADQPRRLLRLRHPRTLARCRSGARVLVRAGHDRRCRRDQQSRSGPGQRPHQHLPAGGRRAGPGRPGHDRQLTDRKCVERRARRFGGGQVGAHGRIPVGVPDRGGAGRPRLRAGLPDDQPRGLTAPRRGGGRREHGLKNLVQNGVRGCGRALHGGAPGRRQ